MSRVSTLSSDRDAKAGSHLTAAATAGNHDCSCRICSKDGRATGEDPRQTTAIGAITLALSFAAKTVGPRVPVGIPVRPAAFAGHNGVDRAGDDGDIAGDVVLSPPVMVPIPPS